MKKFIIFFWIIFSFGSLFANDVQVLNSKITDVTIFLKSAQIRRVKKVSIKKGETTLKFIGISKYIDENSITIKNNGDLRILSVQSEDIEKSDTLKINRFNRKISFLQTKVRKLKNLLKIKNKELNFLDKKRKITKKNSIAST